jgi:hypothetical protein
MKLLVIQIPFKKVNLNSEETQQAASVPAYSKSHIILYFIHVLLFVWITYILDRNSNVAELWKPFTNSQIIAGFEKNFQNAQEYSWLIKFCQYFF